MPLEGVEGRGEDEGGGERSEPTEAIRIRFRKLRSKEKKEYRRWSAVSNSLLEISKFMDETD